MSGTPKKITITPRKGGSQTVPAPVKPKPAKEAADNAKTG